MRPEYLRSVRRACGLSARALSELTGGALTRDNISDFENGRRAFVSVQQAQCLAEVFGVTLQCLVDESLNASAIGIAYKLRQEPPEILEDVAVLLRNSLREVQL